MVDNDSGSANNPATDKQAKRRKDFNGQEYEFIEQMTLRWQWYLLAENSFPLDTSEAQELCIAFAEKKLEVPRSVVGNGKRLFGYVSL